MNNGLVHKDTDNLTHHRSYMALGAIIILGCLALALAFNYLVPPQSRACALMAGFCSQKSEERKLKPFQEIDSIKRGGGKFDLAPYVADLH
jgi:hypothetical protein